MIDLHTQRTDLGTPPVAGEARVRLTIDGQAVEVPAGTSLMRAALDAGIGVAKLCATDSLNASTSRKSSRSAPGTGRASQVAPPSVVRTTVPFAPLAHATRSETALTPRNRAATRKPTLPRPQRIT